VVRRRKHSSWRAFLAPWQTGVGHSLDLDKKRSKFLLSKYFELIG